MAKREYFYGGQAVLEGVMMRGPNSWGIAVRRPSQEIYVERNPVKGLAGKYPLFRKPLFRGVAALGEAMTIGVRALSISANQSMDEDEKLTPKQMALSLAIAAVFFITVFIVLPTVGVGLFRKSGPRHSSLVSNLIEGGVRLAIFIGYLTAISFVKDIRRVFMYHGAEHKTIAAHEAGEATLTPEIVDKYSTLHVRCGTNFLIMVMLLTIVVYSFLGYPAWYWRILSRVALVPLIAGLSYEGLRLGANHIDNIFVRAMMKPGIWLQMITTKPPTHDQIEVAIRAFESVLPAAEAARLVPTSLPSPTIDGGSSVQPGWVPTDPAPLPDPGSTPGSTSE